MIKRTINYIDFNGNQRTEDAYFNMTKTELIAFSFDMPDAITDAAKNTNNVDLEAAGTKLVEKMGTSGIFNFVKDLVFKAYGKKSEDGRRFVKSEEMATEFTQTLAYDEFMIDLFSDDKKAAEFINGIIPADMAKQISGNGNIKLVE